MATRYGEEASASGMRAFTLARALSAYSWTGSGKMWRPPTTAKPQDCAAPMYEVSEDTALVAAPLVVVLELLSTDCVRDDDVAVEGWEDANAPAPVPSALCRDSSTEKMCMVPVEDPTSRKQESGQKESECTVACVDPLRKEHRCWPEGMPNTRMTVPTVDTVASIWPLLWENASEYCLILIW